MEADQLLLKTAEVFTNMYPTTSRNNHFDNAIPPHDTNKGPNSVALQFGTQRNFIAEHCDPA
jgi:hypothetical protein